MSYIAVDIESLGSTYDHPVVAVGFVVGDKLGNELESRLFVLPFDESKIEPRCKEEFWDKQPGLLDSFRKSEFKTEKDAWQAISDWLDAKETEYFGIELLSDNPAFDIALIDYNLHLHLNRRPMRYTKAGKYRSISDPSERLHMCPRWFRDTFKENFGFLHSHNPCDDARYIYLSQIYSEKYYHSNIFSFLTWKIPYLFSR